jgi:hypothetical protein
MRPHESKSRPVVRRSFSKARVAAGILAFFLTFVLVAGALVYTAPKHSSDDAPFNFLRSLRTVSVLEMPDRAVSIIQARDPARQNEMIQESLKAVSVLARPGIMPYMVSALARQFPDRLEVILATAVDLQPDLVLVYAKCCVVQQPAKVEQISYVLARKTPWNAAAIAKTMAAETRDADAITRGLQKGIPEYHPQSDLFEADNPTNYASPSPGVNLASPDDRDQQPK